MSVLGSRMSKVPEPLAGSVSGMVVNAAQEPYVPSVSMADNPLFGILNPESICIMGASNRINSMGTSALLNITGSGFTGPVYVVHPRDRSIQDVETFPRMEDLPEVPDLIVLVVPTSIVPEMLERAGKIGTRHAVVITAGYNEMGDEGRALQKRIDEVVERYGIRYIGPNCLGFVNARRRINTTTIPYDGRCGGIGLASHSGSYVCQALPYAEDMDLGVAEWISLGNEGNVDVVEALEYFHSNPDIKAVGLYLESIRRPGAFRDAARRLSREKPVVAFYSGGTPEGSRAAASHTAAVAGSGRIMEGFLRQCGIVQAETSMELFEWLNAFERMPLPRGPRVAILTNSGGPGTSMADQVGKSELTLARFSPELREKIGAVLPHTGSPGNPIDLSFSSDMSVYGEKLPRMLAEAPEVDAILVYGLGVYAIDLWKRIGTRAKGKLPSEMVQGLKSMLEAQSDTMSDALKAGGKPVLAANLDASMDEGVRRMMVEGGIPVYNGPEQAVKALEAMWRYKKMRDELSF
jgi:acyl-CoA synthetase (NDP forming)